MDYEEYEERHERVLDITRKFARGRFSKKRFFQELESVESLNDKVALKDLDKLKVFLLGKFDEYIQNKKILKRGEYEQEVSETILHEEEHAKRIRDYGLTPSFSVIRLSYGSFGGEIFAWTAFVSPKDFMDVAPTWTKRKILECLAYIGKVTDPSQGDRDIVSACTNPCN